MSFGISVGDFLALVRLIHDITGALRGSKLEYQELVRELDSLDRALRLVDHLKDAPGQTIAIDHIRCAALMCRQPLEDFQRKMQKFEKSFDLGKSDGVLKDAAKKAQWAFGLGKRDEVDRLRSYLTVHIGAINMQLMQHCLETVDLTSEERAEEHKALKNSMAESTRELRDVRGDIQVEATVVNESKSMIQALRHMVEREIAAPLRALTGIVTGVYQSTQRIHNIALEIRASTSAIDTRFSYFQAPVKVEDVLGRVFPFPAEFSIATLDAEIKDRFKKGPGKMEVAAGDYEIFNAKNTNELLDISNDSVLRPGMTVSMSIILERKAEEDGTCPVLQCKSSKIVDTAGGQICSECDTWFKSGSKKRKRDTDSEQDYPPESANAATKSRTQWSGRTYNALNDNLHTERDELSRQWAIFKRISLIPVRQTRPMIGISSALAGWQSGDPPTVENYQPFSSLQNADGGMGIARYRTHLHRPLYEGNRSIIEAEEHHEKRTRFDFTPEEVAVFAQEMEFDPSGALEHNDYPPEKFGPDLRLHRSPRARKRRKPEPSQGNAVPLEFIGRQIHYNSFDIAAKEPPPLSESSEDSESQVPTRQRSSKPRASQGDAVLIHFMSGLDHPELAHRAGESPLPLSDDSKPEDQPIYADSTGREHSNLADIVRLAESVFALTSVPAR